LYLKLPLLEKTNKKARVKEKKNRFLSQNSNLRASIPLANLGMGEK
jgi:hypothetical protein